MFFNRTFLEGCDIHQIEHQSDANSDVTSLWIPAKNYDKHYILLVKGGTEDVDDLGLEIQQAKDSSGTDAKELTVERVWSKSGAIGTVGQWSDESADLSTPSGKLAFGASVPSGFTRVVADVNTGALALLVEIPTETLDNANAFTHIGAFIEGDNVDNAALVSIFWIGFGARYSNEIPLTVI